MYQYKGPNDKIKYQDYNNLLNAYYRMTNNYIVQRQWTEYYRLSDIGDTDIGIVPTPVFEISEDPTPGTAPLKRPAQKSQLRFDISKVKKEPEPKPKKGKVRPDFTKYNGEFLEISDDDEEQGEQGGKRDDRVDGSSFSRNDVLKYFSNFFGNKDKNPASERIQFDNLSSLPRAPDGTTPLSVDVINQLLDDEPAENTVKKEPIDIGNKDNAALPKTDPNKGSPIDLTDEPKTDPIKGSPKTDPNKDIPKDLTDEPKTDPIKGSPKTDPNKDSPKDLADETVMQTPEPQQTTELEWVLNKANMTALKNLLDISTIDGKEYRNLKADNDRDMAIASGFIMDGISVDESKTVPVLKKAIVRLQQQGFIDPNLKMNKGPMIVALNEFFNKVFEQAENF